MQEHGRETGRSKKDDEDRKKGRERASERRNVEVQGQSPGIEKKLEEILKKIEDLEKKTEEEKKKEASDPWTEVVKRNKKRITEGSSTQITRRETVHKEMVAEEREKRADAAKKKTTPLRMIKRKVARGTGIIIELQSNNKEEYEKIIRRCQKEISLEELGIPPIGIKKTRNGGILLEIKCKEKEEEKAELLANEIKKMVKSVEGAQVRRPLRRLRLRIVGLPFGATAAEVAEAVEKIGDGRVGSVRVGPLRTSVSGAGTAWADCPTQVALKAAEAAGLTLGWARVGVTLERGGAPSATAAWRAGTSGGGVPPGLAGGTAA